MRAARLHAYGELPRIEEVADPVIMGSDDVIVRVGASGLCRTDLHVVDGVFESISRPLPYTLGHETAGWVHEVGSGDLGFAPGDAVIVHPYLTCGRCGPCRAGEDQLCERFAFAGAMVDGGFADCLLTSSRSLVKLDRSTSPVEAAGLADGGLAAYRAIKRVVPRLPPGSTAVVLGAGGLGHIAVQVLRAMTASDVIAVDRSPAALELAGSLGATIVIHADGGQVAAVRAATGGRGATVVFDFVGDGTTPADGLAMLGRGGCYVAVGYGGRLEIDTADLVVGELTVMGSLVGTIRELGELVALAERSAVRVTTRLYSLAEIQAAMTDLRAGRVRGRAVIVP
jgi:NAD+-dependent secondary alcohol dehydrogenase Adh1